MVIDTSHGVNALTIQMGHLADAIAYCLGEWEEISASTATVRPEVTVVESGDRIGVSTPDQVLLNGTLSGGVPVSVHLRGGATRGSTNLLWEINGTEGDLLISGGNVHVSTEDGGALELHGGRGDDAELAPLAIPESYRIVGADVPEGPPRNVARLYTQFAADLRDGTAVTPSFEHALFRYRTVDAIEEAVRSGLRQTIAVPLAG
jgi:predicted dehydrogenase